jgi:hypothetical protein
MIGWQTIIGGDDEQVAESVAGNSVDGYMDAGTVGAGVDGSSGWHMR